MHSKIYKAKLISVHSAQKEEKTPEKPEKAIAIHAYFGMLQHIFQRNKRMIKELKLSGTKIQHKSRQNIKALIQGKKQSDLVRSNIKQQNQSQPQFQQLLRQTSLHSHSPMASQRYQSVQPRYLRKMTQKSALYNPKEQIPQFIPIGQASQKKFGLSKQIQNGNDNCLRSQGFIILKFNNNNYLKQGKTEKQIPQASRKNSIRANRRKLTTKSQPNEQVTSYSSIRTSQNSKKEVKTARKLAKLPQEVTPW